MVETHSVIIEQFGAKIWRYFQSNSISILTVESIFFFLRISHIVWRKHNYVIVMLHIKLELFVCILIANAVLLLWSEFYNWKKKWSSTKTTNKYTADVWMNNKKNVKIWTPFSLLANSYSTEILNGKFGSNERRVIFYAYVRSSNAVRLSSFSTEHTVLIHSFYIHWYLRTYPVF